MLRAVYIHFLKINLSPPWHIHFLLSSLFWESSQPLGQDQQNIKQIYCQLLIIIFLWTPKGFIFLEPFLNFLLNLYIRLWLRKSFKFILLRLPQIHLSVKKLNLFNFTHVPQAKVFPRFLSLSPRQTGFAHSSRTPFSEEIFSWAERGGRGLCGWKNCQN